MGIALGVHKKHPCLRNRQRKRAWQRRLIRSFLKEEEEQQNVVSQRLRKEVIISGRQWPTVSKQDTGLYEKEVVGECAGCSVYLLFSPLSVPVDFIACPLPSG